MRLCIEVSWQWWRQCRGRWKVHYGATFNSFVSKAYISLGEGCARIRGHTDGLNWNLRTIELSFDYKYTEIVTEIVLLKFSSLWNKKRKKMWKFIIRQRNISFSMTLPSSFFHCFLDSKLSNLTTYGLPGSPEARRGYCRRCRQNLRTPSTRVRLLSASKAASYVARRQSPQAWYTSKERG